MSTVGTPKSPEQIQHDWDHNPRWKGITRTYTPTDVVALQGHVVEESTLARRGAEVLWEQLHDMELRQLAGRADRQPGRAAGPCRPEGHLPVGLAGRRRREPVRPHLPRPEPVPGQLGAAGGPSHQQRAAARRPDRQGRGRPLGRELAGADRRRRRSRLRWRAQRLRTAEGHDRRRCRRFALGGPAGVGEEMRPPRWQGADPHPAAHPHPDLGPPRGRRRRRADGGHRPHRRRGSHADHLRRRRARSAVHHR